MHQYQTGHIDKNVIESLHTNSIQPNKEIKMKQKAIKTFKCGIVAYFYP